MDTALGGMLVVQKGATDLPIWVLLALGTLGAAGIFYFYWVIEAMDHARIKEYIAKRGGTVSSIRWPRWGSTWSGDNHSSVYIVRYRDQEGNLWETKCKTGFWSGVFFSEESICSAAPLKPMAQPESPPLSGFDKAQQPNLATPADQDVQHADRQSLQAECQGLREENRLLREELDRLRG